MFHSFKRIWLVLVLLLAGAQSIFGFAYLGPFNEAYQVAAIGYDLSGVELGLGNDGFSADLGAPKNFGQGFRWNTPTNYYAYDSTFLSFFGSNGVAAVDAAFAVYNNLTNVSGLNVNSFPLQTTRFNYEAQALGLQDLKTTTMSLIIEQLGLAYPDRYVWCLHDRDTTGLTCPAYAYLVIQRNFDPITYNYSAIVNGVLYDYVIVELCQINPAPFGGLSADAIEIPVDPTQIANEGSAVAAGFSGLSPFGAFYTGLTRDDVGGLKALYSATNVFEESTEPNSVQVFTNEQAIQILVTSNLSLFLAQALTNSAANLIALYPGLVIVSNTIIGFSNVVTTNYTAVAVNPPYAAAGTIITTIVPVLTTNILTLYSNVYGNIVIVNTNSTSSINLQTVSITAPPYGVAGQLVQSTNNSITYYNDGAFYILPAGLCGPYEIVATQLVTAVTVSNAIAINTTAVTNTTGVTNTGELSASVITTYDQYSLVVVPVQCLTNGVALREGMDTPVTTNFITFVRQDYDSLLSRTWTPVTNEYQLTAVTNGQPFVQHFQRVLTAPDIILTSQDITGGPAGLLYDPSNVRTTPHFNVSQVPANQGGPGTITPQGINFIYNSVGPLYENLGPSTTSFLYPGAATFAQALSVPLFQWASFDGTTNAPVVYPSTTSLASLQAQVFFQITNSPLANASVKMNGSTNRYSVRLGATGGSPPYGWSLASGSPGLPAGLSLSAAGVISGSPTTQGIYDFIVQATDAGSRTTQAALSMMVGP